MKMVLHAVVDDKATNVFEVGKAGQGNFVFIFGFQKYILVLRPSIANVFRAINVSIHTSAYSRSQIII